MKLAPFIGSVLITIQEGFDRCVRHANAMENVDYMRPTHYTLLEPKNIIVDLLTPFSASLRPIEYQMQASQWATNM